MIKTIVFAANTDTGKTLLSTALSRTVSHAWFIKPVQTGYPVDSDARFVATFNPRITHSSVLFAFRDPVSPHMAAITESRAIADHQVIASLNSAITEAEAKLPSTGLIVIETAGGVNSPSISGTLQSNLFIPFKSSFPITLIGDSNLGGISTTICSYESLHRRGYSIPLVLMFDRPQYKNHEIIEKYVDKGHVVVVPVPPERVFDPQQDDLNLRTYFDSIQSIMNQSVDKIKRF